ncbi:hypothetical protein Tco_1331764, partial [Tanacetum coccineum]
TVPALVSAKDVAIVTIARKQKMQMRREGVLLSQGLESRLTKDLPSTLQTELP